MTTVVVGAALVHDGLLLAAQRSYPPELAGRWELPGGAVEDGEDEPTALARECREELAVTVLVGARVEPEVALPGARVLRVRWCTLTRDDEQPQACEHAALRWVGADELDDVDWLETDRALLPALRRGLGVL